MIFSILSHFSLDSTFSIQFPPTGANAPELCTLWIPSTSSYSLLHQLLLQQIYILYVMSFPFFNSSQLAWYAVFQSTSFYMIFSIQFPPTGAKICESGDDRPCCGRWSSAFHANPLTCHPIPGQSFSPSRLNPSANISRLVISKTQVTIGNISFTLSPRSP